MHGYLQGSYQDARLTKHKFPYMHLYGVDRVNFSLFHLYYLRTICLILRLESEMVTYESKHKYKQPSTQTTLIRFVNDPAVYCCTWRIAGTYFWHKFHHTYKVEEKKLFPAFLSHRKANMRSKFLASKPTHLQNAFQFQLSIGYHRFCYDP